MKRFDLAEKVLQDEIFRITGKVAFNAVEHNHNPSYATRVNKVLHLKEAIKILSEHERNKHV